MFQILIKKLKNAYSSSPSLQKLIKSLTSSNLYYQISKRFIDKQIQKDLKGPFNLLIETTNICNAKCIMCPHRIMKRKQKVMSDKTFNQIIKRVKKEKLAINKVYLNGFGEPFADPKFLDRVKKLKDLNLFITFYTNASLLNPKIAKSLIDLKVDEVNISFNAVTPKSYEKVMGLNYKNTIKNIDNLINQRKEESLPFIKISSVITKLNEKDIKKHFENWQHKVNLVTVTQAHEWGGAVDNKSHHKFIKNPRTYPCRSLWHTIAIDVEGNFVLCCRDYESKYKLSNIKTQSFSDFQKNPTLNKIRKSHLTYQKKNLPHICQGCNFPYQDGVEWYLPKSLS